MDNSQKQRMFCELAILGFVAITTIAVCDKLDNKTYYEKVDNIKVEKATLYYSDEKGRCTYFPYGIGGESDDTDNNIKEKETVINCSLNTISGIVPTYEWTTEIVVSDESYTAENDTYFESTSFVDEQNLENDTEQLETNNEYYVSLEIPYGDTSCMMFMDYRTLTDTSSKQWQLQKNAWTDLQGFRRIGDDYCVALGTYYGEIGDRFRITTDKGNTYTVIEADVKGNDAVFYNDYQSWYHVCGDGRLNVVEFICDTDCLDSSVWTMGDCGVLDNIGGNVVSIERID